MSTVAVTGGTGTVGRAVLANLVDAGYVTVCLARGRPDDPVADRFVRTDVTDAGDVYGALATVDPDAVVHLAAIPTPENDPGHAVFRSNVMGTYHVLAASSTLGVEHVCAASSLSALGAGFEPTPVSPDYLPVDEAHPLSPSNPYGLGKQVVEVTADGFARRADTPRTIATVRFPWVTTPEDVRETFVRPDRSLDAIRGEPFFHGARNTFFSYLHVDDAAAFVRAALETDLGGHERFFAAADDTTVETPTAEVVAACYPDAERRLEFDGYESLVGAEKAEAVLGWQPERSWRD